MLCSVQIQRGLTNHGRLTALAYAVMLVLASKSRTQSPRFLWPSAKNEGSGKMHYMTHAL